MNVIIITACAKTLCTFNILCETFSSIERDDFNNRIV